MLPGIVEVRKGDVPAQNEVKPFPWSGRPHILLEEDDGIAVLHAPARME
jgi:hypothetical protein